MIAGLLQGGPASKLRDKLRPGDWLRSIDGQQVRLTIRFYPHLGIIKGGKYGGHFKNKGDWQCSIDEELPYFLPCMLDPLQNK